MVPHVLPAPGAEWGARGWVPAPVPEAVCATMGAAGCCFLPLLPLLLGWVLLTCWSKRQPLVAATMNEGATVI